RLTMLGRNVLALAAGAAGGALFYWLRMPLAWMLGAMTATALLALSGARPEVVSGLRSGLVMVLGVLLGSSFSPSLLGHLRDWVDSF
ncbi:AbrB family transcriptional regulator, partial [Acinetobacter baumannii]